MVLSVFLSIVSGIGKSSPNWFIFIFGIMTYCSVHFFYHLLRVFFSAKKLSRRQQQITHLNDTKDLEQLIAIWGVQLEEDFCKTDDLCERKKHEEYKDAFSEFHEKLTGLNEKYC
jgi:hypothetical protein